MKEENQKYLEQRGWIRTHLIIPWQGDDLFDAYVPPNATPEKTAAGDYLLTDSLGDYTRANLDILVNRFE